jgi:hypothetical protein
MDDLVRRVRSRATSAEPTDCGRATETTYPPVGPTSIAKAENATGYRLPLLLVRLYSEVGNGGFGPDYGLLGIDGGAGNEGGHDALALYQGFRQADKRDPQWSWPANFLPLVHCGCAMYLCVDCASPDGRVVWFEPNPHTPGQSWDDSFIPLSCNLEQLMEAWVQGESWLDRFTPLKYRS